MEALGRTASALAEQLDRAVVRRWMNGTSPDGVPPTVAEWIARRADTAMSDLVVSRTTLVMQCRACSRASRVSVIPVLSEFGHRYGVRGLERVYV